MKIQTTFNLYSLIRLTLFLNFLIQSIYEIQNPNFLFKKKFYYLKNMKLLLEFLTSLPNFQRGVHFREVTFTTSNDDKLKIENDLYIFKDEIDLEEYKNFICDLLIQKFSIEEKYHDELDKKLMEAINEQDLLQRN